MECVRIWLLILSSLRCIAQYEIVGENICSQNLLVRRSHPTQLRSLDLLWMYLWTYNLIQKKYVAEGKTFFHIENYIKRPSETSGSADGEGAEDEDNSDSASKTSGGGVDTAEEDK